MDIITTVISVTFVAVILIIGLLFALATFYRPYVLIRLEILTRRYASALWFRACMLEDQNIRDKLFDLSRKIELFAVAIRENHIALKDFTSLIDKMEDSKKNNDASKTSNLLNTESCIKIEERFGDMFLTYVMFFALSVRYPLTIGIILLNFHIFHILISQWKKVNKIFLSLNVGDLTFNVGEMPLQSIPA